MNNTKEIKLPMAAIKVYISCPQCPSAEVEWLPSPAIRVDSIEAANLVMFTGGADVDPSLYGFNKALTHPQTCSDAERDAFDLEAYNQVMQLPSSIRPAMIGICRGAQFLCVMAGGKLVQDQSNAGPHAVKTFTNNVFTVTSDHHQAQYPWGIQKKSWDLLSWTNGVSYNHAGWNHNGAVELVRNRASAFSQYGFIGLDLPEVEDVYYREINALAIQSHPEWAAQLDHEQERYVSSLAYHRSLVLRLMAGWDIAGSLIKA
jgi:hypothetical protein